MGDLDVTAAQEVQPVDLQAGDLAEAQTGAGDECHDGREPRREAGGERVEHLDLGHLDLAAPRLGQPYAVAR